MTISKKKVLFVCTYNSARSPIAEGILKAERGELYDAKSAGIYPSDTDMRAVFVMREAGYDISSKKPVSIGECCGNKYDIVVFLCENAYKNALRIPEAEEIILRFTDMPCGFKDPLEGFSMLRDDLKDWILNSSVFR